MLREGQIVVGPQFSEPMVAETLRADGVDTWVVGLVGVSIDGREVQRVRFRTRVEGERGHDSTTSSARVCSFEGDEMMRQVDGDLLNEMVRRIVEVAHPKRIILFGSAARNQMGPHSDLDVLVVVPDGVHRRKTAQEIYRKLAGLGVAKDVLVVTEGDLEKYGDNPSLVVYPALREGRELYRAAG
jgi:predicted nucleotidyltransferase